ncbi:hypothetical protein SAMN04487948_107106 [Halogranum amylolyticum]|uniref:Uncharacterized protein n=1 Tax=Halogranum amylolyticum TaxID=660520 RepID=A0A1H8TIY3_9EURY|nr:hypothetical protein [Halogranum amylolyticum]SEO91050.1 hypothetical protein SAMN04487948_107106 [Halogranum amylolyticum]
MSRESRQLFIDDARRYVFQKITGQRWDPHGVYDITRNRRGE